MERIVFVVVVASLLAIVSVSAAASIGAPNSTENQSEARALYASRSSGLVQKVQCITDTIDGVVNEYKCQPVWDDVQRKLQNNISNMFACLRHTGFSAQGLFLFIKN